MLKMIIAAATLVAVAGCGFIGVPGRTPPTNTTVGAANHRVQTGESIYSIATRYGTTAEAIADNNGLAPPYTLTAGQTLFIPSSSSYVVQQGETLYDIATRQGVDVGELARINGIGLPYEVAPGQTLRLPYHATSLASGPLPTGPVPSGDVQVSALAPNGTVAGQGVYPIQPQVGTAYPTAAVGAPQPLYDAPSGSLAGPGTGDIALLPPASNGQVPPPPPPSDLAVTPPADIVQPDVASPPSLTAPQLGSVDLPPSPVQPSEPAAVAPAPAATAGAAEGFLWPVRGDILSNFAAGGANDGINIAAPSGTPVRAAEAGTVAYVGQDIASFGNLVLVRHQNDWVTAYAHNEAVLVSEGESVARGQVIARVGQSGDVSQPQLHFELRRGTDPVDPMPHLPQ